MVQRNSEYLKQQTISILTVFLYCCLRVQMTVSLLSSCFKASLQAFRPPFRAPKPGNCHCNIASCKLQDPNF